MIIQTKSGRDRFCFRLIDFCFSVQTPGGDFQIPNFHLQLGDFANF